eukprot:14773323-Alexandrium_andersonii.AAC.1
MRLVGSGISVGRVHMRMHATHKLVGGGEECEGAEHRVAENETGIREERSTRAGNGIRVDDRLIEGNACHRMSS